jgi:hypothetical protein
MDLPGVQDSGYAEQLGDVSVDTELGRRLDVPASCLGGMPTAGIAAVARQTFRAAGTS